MLLLPLLWDIDSHLRSFTLWGESSSVMWVKECLNLVMCLEAPLFTSQTLLPCVTVPVSVEIKTYSSSLEESSLALLLSGWLSSVTWAWCLLFFHFSIGQYIAKCHFSSQVKHLSCDYSFFWNVLGFLREFSSFLPWDIRAWFSSSPIFSSLTTNQDYSCMHSSHRLLNLVSLLLVKIPWMKYSHDIGRPFKVIITTYTSSTLSPIASSFYLVWETLVN